VTYRPSTTSPSSDSPQSKAGSRESEVIVL
jgi:hypothetical protein